MKVKVKFEHIPAHTGHSKVYRMAAVPREGEAVAFNGEDAAYFARAVMWTPYSAEHDAIVRYV